jgi:hypothetical protein
MLNIIIDSYFGLVGKQLMQEILKPVFTKKLFDTEWFCFDLRSDREDQSPNQREFLKVLRTVLDPFFSKDLYSKIPNDIK